MEGRPAIQAGQLPADLERALELAGGPRRLAAVFGVRRQTVYRWLAGERPLGGLATFALAAFVKHPDDYPTEGTPRADDQNV